MEDIKKYIDSFDEDRINNKHRYASFDFCYEYFYYNRGNLLGGNLQISCSQLWSYLGSWGMVARGNELQNRSYASLVDIISVINNNPEYYSIAIDSKNYVEKMNEMVKEKYKAYLRVAVIAYDNEAHFYENCGFETITISGSPRIKSVGFRIQKFGEGEDDGKAAATWHGDVVDVALEVGLVNHSPAGKELQQALGQQQRQYGGDQRKHEACRHRLM